MRNFRNTRAYLSDVKYNFNKKIEQKVDIHFQDYLNIEEIKDDVILCKITRSIIFVPSDKTIKDTNEMQVSFLANIFLNQRVSAEEFKKDVKTGLDVLNPVFEMLSLTISNLTVNSVWGPIITIPTYHEDDIIIS
mgnify:CR=1 FL=1